jgi:hypothetical protein
VNRGYSGLAGAGTPEGGAVSARGIASGNSWRRSCFRVIFQFSSGFAVSPADGTRAPAAHSFGCVTTRTSFDSNCRTPAKVPSVDPSSTTMTSSGATFGQASRSKRQPTPRRHKRKLGLKQARVLLRNDDNPPQWMVPLGQVRQDRSSSNNDVPTPPWSVSIARR